MRMLLKVSSGAKISQIVWNAKTVLTVIPVISQDKGLNDKALRTLFMFSSIEHEIWLPKKIEWWKIKIFHALKMFRCCIYSA